jgi:streptogramin lyase
MDEYISRNEAINAIKSLESSMPAKDNYAKGYDAALGRALIAVREAPPAADVQPVKRGRWIKAQDKQGSYFLCSNCGTAEKTESDQDGTVWQHDEYCRKCGARMDGDSE